MIEYVSCDRQCMIGKYKVHEAQQWLTRAARLLRPQMSTLKILTAYVFGYNPHADTWVNFSSQATAFFELVMQQ